MIKNNVYASSLNLVTAILTIRSSDSAIVKGTTNSEVFRCFMQGLMTQIETTDEIPANEVLCILDNAP